MVHTPPPISMISKDDLKNDDNILIPRILLESILHEFIWLHGLYTTDLEDIVKQMDKDVWFHIDNLDIINKIEEFLD
ncbi:hypothetical protein [Methanosphaera sp.]